MPWRDVTMKLSGKTVVDLKRHFVQYWNFAMFQLKERNEVFEENFEDRMKKVNKRGKKHGDMSEISVNE